MNKTNFDKDLERELKEDPALAAEMQVNSLAYDISMQIYKLRKEKRYTQQKLAKCLKMSQSNIARLEKGEYAGYSLTTLTKIAEALGSFLSVKIRPEQDYYSRLLSYLRSKEFKQRFEGIINGHILYSKNFRISSNNKLTTKTFEDYRGINSSYLVHKAYSTSNRESGEFNRSVVI